MEVKDAVAIKFLFGMFNLALLTYISKKQQEKVRTHSKVDDVKLFVYQYLEPSQATKK